MLLCSIFFMIRSFVQDVDHNVRTHKLELEKMELNYNLGELFKEYQGAIKAISARDDKLEEAVDFIKGQGALMERLIQRLKELGEWPIPPSEPIDPKRII